MDSLVSLVPSQRLGMLDGEATALRLAAKPEAGNEILKEF